MNNNQAGDAQQLILEGYDDRRPTSHAEVSKAQIGEATVPDWITMPQEKCGGVLSQSDGWQSFPERIACLECIVAILIEKNERMRQQLMRYLD